ncbi:MAG: integrase [Candidatus Nitrosomirales archaeon]|jgi:integrase
MELAFNKDSFLDRVYRKSKSTKSRDGAKSAIDTFEKYCLARFSRSTEEVIANLIKGKHDIYRVLDDFVGYMQGEQLATSVVHMRMAWVKSYLVYRDVNIDRYKFRQLVSMPRIEEHEDAVLDMKVVRRILLVLPTILRLFCMMVLTTLRRPNELLQLRVRDIDFESNPTMIRIPAEISKNRKEGITFCTSECTSILKEVIRVNRLGPDSYLFPWAGYKKPVGYVDNYFAYQIKTKLPDLAETIKGLKVKALKIHIYSFKDFGFTQTEKMHGISFASGLKGDKKSPYHKLSLEEKRAMYLELEPKLTIFTEIQESKDDEIIADQSRRIANVEKQVQTLTTVVQTFIKEGYRLTAMSKQGKDIEVKFEETEQLHKSHS